MLLLELDMLLTNRKYMRALLQLFKEKYDLDSDAVSIDFVGPTMGRTLIQNAVMSVLIAQL